jgi:uncharacterized phage-associated protein
MTEMNGDLTFSFDRKKFVQALVFFARNGIADLTKMKIHKLLFFADKLHLTRYGRPIIGDHYYAMRFGPVPSTVDNYLDAVEEVLVSCGANDTEREFEGYLRMEPTETYPVVRATGREDFRVFSRSDLRILQEVVDSYGPLSAARLSKIAHDDPAYRIPDKTRPEYGRAEMPYELFFESEDDKSMLDVALAEQEHRDLVASLR